MVKWIIPVILIFPIIEIWGILQVGDWLGGWNTFLLLLVTSGCGAYFARLEGRKVWQEVQRQTQQGIMPGRSMIDGLCVLVGGLLLLLPGFFSDIAGLLLLLPPTRPIFKGLILKWLEKVMKNGNYSIRRY
ncbi:FxsA family protein [Paenibacillus sp. CAU 1782]